MQINDKEDNNKQLKRAMTDINSAKQYWAYASILCSLIDQEFNNNKISILDKKNQIIALATYFSGNTKLKDYVSPIAIQPRHQRKLSYFRVDVKESPLIPYWVSLFLNNTMSENQELVWKAIARNCFFVQSDLAIIKSLTTQSDVPGISINNKIEFNSYFKEQHSLKAALEKYKEIFWFSEESFQENLQENTISSFTNQTKSLTTFLESFKSYLDSKYPNDPNVSISELLELTNFINITKIKNSPYKVTLFFNKDFVMKANPFKKENANNNFIKDIGIINQHREFDPATLAESICYLEKDKPAIEILKNIILNLNLSVPRSEPWIQELKNVGIIKPNVTIKFHKIPELKQQINEQFFDLLEKNHPTLKKYLPIIQASFAKLKTAEFKDNKVTTYYLQNIVAILAEINTNLNVMTETKIYAIYIDLYEKIKSLSLLMKHDTLKTNPLIEELYKDKNLQGYYCPFAMQAIPCIIQIIANIIQNPQISIDPFSMYYETIDVVNNMIKNNNLKIDNTAFIMPNQKRNKMLMAYNEKTFHLSHLQHMDENSFIIVDITAGITNEEFLKSIAILNETRPDITIIAVASLNKYASAGTNTSSLGYILLNQHSPFFKQIDTQLKKIANLVNPLQIKFFESIGTKHISDYEKSIHKSLEILKSKLIIDEGFLFSIDKQFCNFKGSKQKIKMCKKFINNYLTNNNQSITKKILHISSFGAPITTGTIFALNHNDYRWRINLGSLDESEINLMVNAINALLEVHNKCLLLTNNSIWKLLSAAYDQVSWMDEVSNEEKESFYDFITNLQSIVEESIDNTSLKNAIELWVKQIKEHCENFEEQLKESSFFKDIMTKLCHILLDNENPSFIEIIDSLKSHPGPMKKHISVVIEKLENIQNKYFINSNSNNAEGPVL